VFGVGLTTPHSKKTYCYESRKKENLDGFNDDAELVTGKNGRVLFDRPKPTVGCSASGRRRRRRRIVDKIKKHISVQ
jgi:uncharacterized protein (DUF1499 family)